MVIGAGVAGASAALGLARRVAGARVLLVERARWPREKVCGCCVNAAGAGMLERLGVQADMHRAGAVALDRVEVCQGKRRAVLEQTGGLAISRAAMDDVLVRSACAAGVIFRDGCSARVELDEWADGRSVRLLGPAGEEVHRAALVLVADGLAGSALKDLAQMRVQVARGSLMGVGAILPMERGPAMGTIQMNVGPHGYVGLVRLDERAVNVAGAIEPAWMKRVGGPEEAVRLILRGCGVELGADMPVIKGTPMLTRRRVCVGASGVLVIGDACGYVEPFTGEGMTWALAGANAAAEIAAGAVRVGNRRAAEEAGDAWEAWHAANLRPRQRTCRVLRRVLRSGTLVGAMLGVMENCAMGRRAGGIIAQRLTQGYALLDGEGAPA